MDLYALRVLIWERVAPSHTGVTHLSDWPEMHVMLSVPESCLNSSLKVWTLNGQLAVLYSTIMLFNIMKRLTPLQTMRDTPTYAPTIYMTHQLQSQKTLTGNANICLP